MKYIIIGIIILMLILLIILKNLTINLNNIKSKNYRYVKKRFLNDNELFFYNCFKKLDLKYIVIPQVSLESIIKKKYYNHNYTYQGELHRILDFCIFDQNLNALLAIEINGKSHNLNKRKYRDYKVKEILKEVNIELLIFNIDYPNTEESILGRTTNVLNKMNK